MTLQFLDTLSTTAIHGGVSPDPTTGAILTPIHLSTTFVQEEVGEDKGFTYSRAGNPTVAALEANLGGLENAPPAVCFATGMAAATALLLAELGDGGHVVVSAAVYGGTVRVLNDLLSRFGVTSTFVDASDPSNVASALRDETRLVLLESPGNPTLKLADIAGVASAIEGRSILLAVDNTLMTAALQQPLELGADISLYSTTKYLEGHNSTLGGAVVSHDEALLDRLRLTRKTIGAGQSPLEAWLTLRGIKTLALRMRQHSENGHAVATYLEAHPLVASVAYPGLRNFEQYELACRQQQGPGGIVSFELVGGVEVGITFINSLKLCSLAENFGAAETLVTHPASMTHADVPSCLRERAGITDGLVRLSVGLERPQDVVDDLKQAFACLEVVR